MLKRWLVIACAVALFLPFGVSCSTTEPVIWSWPHNKRRIQTIFDGFHKLHMDIDRVIFDMDEHPIEADY